MTCEKKQGNTEQDEIKLAGVDPGYKISTLCVLSFKGNVLFLNSMSNDLKKLWVEHLEGINILFIEDQYVSKNINSTKKLAQGAGIINGYALVAEIKDIRYVNPKRWQRILQASVKTQKGTLKQISKTFASALYGKNIIESDQADAINLAEWGRQQIKVENF